MRKVLRMGAIAAVVLGAAQFSMAQANFDFEDLTDQGFGTGFGNDASASFAIVNIGGSNRMLVPRTSFQSAGRESGNPGDPMYIAMLAASTDEANYIISYDWLVDTSAFGAGAGSFLQLGTFVNTGSGYYSQDFPNTGKDVEIDGVQLASGQTFSGTVTETFSAKGYDLPAGETFFRLGFIINGDGASQAVHFDNVRIYAVPEPTALALLGLPALAIRRRRA